MMMPQNVCHASRTVQYLYITYMYILSHFYLTPKLVANAA